MMILATDGLKTLLLILCVSIGYLIPLTCDALPLHTFNGPYLWKPTVSRFYYETALRLESKGEEKLSEDLLSKAIVINPDNREWLILYANLLNHHQEYDKAANVLRRMIASSDSTREQAKLYYGLSVLYERTDDLTQAIAMLEKAISLAHTQVPANYYYDLGVLYGRFQNYEKTKALSLKAVTVDPNFSSAWNNYGYSLALLNELSKAKQAIEKALDLDPTSPHALDSMGYILMRLEQYPQAIDFFNKALQYDPSMTDTMYYLGQAYEKTEQWQKAHETYQLFLLMTHDPAKQAEIEHRLQQLPNASSPLEKGTP